MTAPTTGGREADAITVLLADDHTMMRDGLRAMLERRPGFEVVAEAADGREAVARAREHHPRVAVVDIAMPLLNGVEATRKILRDCPGTGVVILSVHGTSEHVYQALRAGALGYLLKESAGSELIEAVEAVAAGKRYLSRQVSEVVADHLVRRAGENGERGPLDRLSERERQVLQLVVEGRSSKEIGALLALSPKTVDTYRSRLMEKLGIDNLPDLVRFAMRMGLGGG